jgi:hypothetical protein
MKKKGKRRRQQGKVIERHLDAEDLQKGLQVTAIIKPLEGSSLPPKVISAKIDEVVRKGKADDGKETTNPLKLGKRARVIGAYLHEIGKTHSGSIYAKLKELFPAEYAPPPKQDERKALPPFKNPDLVFEWAVKSTKATKPFRLADMIRAAKVAGSSNPQDRAAHVLRALLKQGKIRVSSREGGRLR